MIKDGDNKLCTTCKQIKSVSEYHIRRASVDGLALICRECSASKQRAYYARTSDEAKARAKKWTAENGEKRRQILAKHHVKYREQRILENKARIERLKVDDPERLRRGYRLGSARRRSRDNGGNITSDWWNALLELFEFGTCLYCDTDGHRLVMDHFVPIKLGGRTELGNLLPCCNKCNNNKKSKHPEQWVPADKIEGIRQFLALTCEAAA